MDINEMVRTSSAILIAVAWKVLGAVALWLIGRWLIGFALRLASKALTKEQVDPTLLDPSRPGLLPILNVALVIAVLGLLGVDA